MFIVIVILIIVYFNLLSDYDCLLHENASLRNDNQDLKAENLKLVSEKQGKLDHAKKFFDIILKTKKELNRLIENLSILRNGSFSKKFI